jgi:hypothetical protein
MRFEFVPVPGPEGGRARRPRLAAGHGLGTQRLPADHGPGLRRG